MAERIEFVGNPLPTGLPGFGGGTVSVLILPGFNTVVAVQQFGPVVNAPEVTVPDVIPPVGSNPADPTNEVVTPNQPPANSGASSNFCDKCVPPTAMSPENALLRTDAPTSSCVNCAGEVVGTIDWFKAAATSAETGIFYGSGSVLRGKESGKKWEIDANPSVGLEIGTAGDADGCALRKDKVYVGTTEYRKGAKIYDGDTSKTYEPQDLQVCEGNQTKTWKVLAYKP
jgi:hypothetical protein